MQNKCCSANDAGYVALNGGWRCMGCGWMNQTGDCCRNCGWNRCGCQGGIVRTENRTARNDCGCAEATSRDRGCNDCPASFTTGHRVQRCPENTRIRRDKECGCEGETAVYQNKCGCEGKVAAYQPRQCQRDCGCESEAAAYQPRQCQRDCGCESEAAAYQLRQCQRDCGCQEESARQQGRGRNAHVGIVHGVKQELADVFESESALRTGTLFPELHKPMNGRCPACSNCSTCQQQAAFAAWDLRLYLNTHPDDAEAKALFRRLQAEAEEPNYATTFLKDGCRCADWNWTDDPWPWECQPCGE